MLITGAGGGLGLHQIQVVKSVKRAGHRRHQLGRQGRDRRQAGADEVIVSPDLKFSREVWRRTGKQGVDVVLENVVSDTFGESLRSAAQNAIIVVLGNIGASGRDRSGPRNHAAHPHRRLRQRDLQGRAHALHLLATRRSSRSSVGAAVSAASEGHAMMEQRGVIGRVVLQGW